MKKLLTAAAALALLAGVTAASAQQGGTPGAGMPGQDERGDTGQAPGGPKTPGTPNVKDAPPSVENLKKSDVNANKATFGSAMNKGVHKKKHKVKKMKNAS